MFGVVRIALGGWSLLLPVSAGRLPDARDRARDAIVSGVVGIVFAPDTSRRDLQDTQDVVTGERRDRRLDAVGAGAG